ncbi:MAG: Crp/Fnr family transcriptional regulator [Pseudobacteriovorax sp.]|nr:Crp/Fnr family transcriptional regulator [Pseudobacteriovorax sp.]
MEMLASHTLKLLGPETKILKKDQRLFAQGEPADTIDIITSGLAKVVYLTFEGNERVKSFFAPGQMIGHISIPKPGNKYLYELICLEDSTFLRFSALKLYQSMKESPTLSQYFLEALLNLAEKKQRREYEFLCLSIEERYQLALQRFSQYSSINQKDLVSYLGVTEVGLSRIKTRLNLKSSAISL